MTETEERAKAKAKPSRKKARPSRADEKMILTAHNLLAHTVVTWFCLQYHPSDYVRKMAEEDIKEAFIMLFRKVMVRPGKRPLWALELEHSFRSSRVIRDRIEDILRIYPWGDSLRLLLSDGSTGAD